MRMFTYIVKLHLQSDITVSLMSRVTHRYTTAYVCHIHDDIRGTERGGGGGLGVATPLNFGRGVEYLSTPPDFESFFIFICSHMLLCILFIIMLFLYAGGGGGGVFGSPQIDLTI